MKIENHNIFENSLCKKAIEAKIGILAHNDGDGIASAAIIKNRFPAGRVYFTNAINLAHDIKVIVKLLGSNPCHIFIVDIAINPKEVQKILNSLLLIPPSCEVHFYDHHQLPANLDMEHFSTLVSDVRIDISTAAACITLLGIVKIISNKVSTNSDTLSRESIIQYRIISWLAAMGGISDLKEDSLIVKSILDVYDKGMLFYEGYCLKNACRKIHSQSQKRDIITALSAGILPSSIQQVKDAASQAALEGKHAIEYIAKNAVKYKNIALISNYSVGSKGMNAYMAATLTNARVGIAWYTNGKNINMSLRRQHSEKDINLHEVAHKTSNFLGGTGGGSPDEAGATVSTEKFNEFILSLDNLIEEIVGLRRINKDTI